VSRRRCGEKRDRGGQRKPSSRPTARHPHRRRHHPRRRSKRSRLSATEDPEYPKESAEARGGVSGNLSPRKKQSEREDEQVVGGARRPARAPCAQTSRPTRALRAILDASRSYVPACIGAGRKLGLTSARMEIGARAPSAITVPGLPCCCNSRSSSAHAAAGAAWSIARRVRRGEKGSCRRARIRGGDRGAGRRFLGRERGFRNFFQRAKWGEEQRCAEERER